MDDKAKKIFEAYEDYMYARGKYLDAATKSQFLYCLHNRYMNLTFDSQLMYLNKERIFREALYTLENTEGLTWRRL